MKDKGISILFITILLFIVLPAKRLNAQNQDISDSGWPKLFIDGKDSILMYQPQVDSWKDNDLIFRSAIGYIAALSNEQKYGVITFSVQTEVDKPNNLVYLSELQISNLNFPTISDNGKKISYLVLNNLKDDNTISLSRLQSDLSINDAINKQVVTVKNDPPEIFCSYNPAVLVIIDGDPQTKQITSSSYSKVINTSAFILKNSQDGSYYLSLFGEWFYSLKISGPWIIYNNAVKEIDALLSNFLTKDSTIQLFRPPSDDIKSYIAKGKQPKIFVANAPSELIIFDGQPQYVPISGTNLLYASNTKANVFKNTTDNLTYILISGRWYSAIDMKGQWSYVDPANLPSDFLKIPADNLKANVLVSIPGTSQSKEAVISNQIPQTAKVKREKVNIDAVYDGEPQYKGVEGTNMEYIVNSPNPVIRIDGEYYMVKDGIWYFSDNYSGPWFVAFEVPVDIYSIPPDCPLYYVTYVRIYDYNDDFVYCGYTPGYFGCFVAPGNVIVYGTGWRYNPWLGNCWYGPPMTFGFGVSFFWSQNSGFYFNYGWGVAHPPFFHPWFGPTAYGPRGVYYGPVNHINAYANARNVVVPSSPRMVNQSRIDKPSANETNKPAFNSINKPNDVFAGKDGNVYRPSIENKASNIPQNQTNDNRSFPSNNAVKTNPNNWQVNNGNGWQQFNKTPNNEQYHPTQVNNLNNSFNARSTGEVRTNNFNQSFHGGESMGGGHFSGGGRR